MFKRKLNLYFDFFFSRLSPDYDQPMNNLGNILKVRI